MFGCRPRSRGVGCPRSALRSRDGRRRHRGAAPRAVGQDAVPEEDSARGRGFKFERFGEGTGNGLEWRMGTPAHVLGCQGSVNGTARLLRAVGTDGPIRRSGPIRLRRDSSALGQRKPLSRHAWLAGCVRRVLRPFRRLAWGVTAVVDPTPFVGTTFDSKPNRNHLQPRDPYSTHRQARPDQPAPVRDGGTFHASSRRMRHAHLPASASVPREKGSGHLQGSPSTRPLRGSLVVRVDALQNPVERQLLAIGT